MEMIGNEKRVPYIIIEAHFGETPLAVQVIEATKKGYKVQGGIAIDNKGSMYQAMALPGVGS